MAPLMLLCMENLELGYLSMYYHINFCPLNCIAGILHKTVLLAFIYRYFAVTAPIKYSQQKDNKQRAYWVIAVCWIASIAIGEFCVLSTYLANPAGRFCLFCTILFEYLKSVIQNGVLCNILVCLFFSKAQLVSLVPI